MTHPGRSTTVAVRLLRPILLLYPAHYRHTYAREMTAAFAERYANVRREAGLLAATRVWLRTALDLVTSAGAEWARSTRRSRGLRQRLDVNQKSRRGDSLVSSIIQDVRQGLRSLRKQPGFAAVAVATLALGTGANTAIFSLVNTVLLEPLPYPDSHELVRIWSSNVSEGRERYFTSPLSFYEWQERTKTLSAIAGAWPREVTLTDDVDRPVLLRTMSATAKWFDILGTPPLLGRTFRPEDQQIAWGSWILVLSNGLWQQRFGGDSTVIGKAIRIDGQPAEIVGVLPRGVGFPETVDLWTNFVPPRTQPAQYMDVIGRMREGVTPGAALADLRAIARGLEEENPQSLAGSSVDLAPLYEVIVGDVRPALLMLMAATVLVLAIACANVANLLLARTEKRYREMALRAALGAGKGRLVRQLLTEGMLLGGLGAIVGVGVALVGLRALMGIVPAGLPRFDGVPLDLPMLGVALASALITGVAFGLTPALQLQRVDLQTELKEGGQRTGGPKRGGVARDSFVVLQMALAVIVSIGAGLLIQSFRNLRETDPGFSSGGVLTFELNLPAADYPSMTGIADSYEELLQGLRAIQGVDRAGITSTLPLTERLDYLLQLTAVGEPPPEPGAEPYAWYRQVSPGFFETMGIALVRGRSFEDRDREDAPAAVVVNRTLARSLFGEDDPVGRRLNGVAGGFGPMGRILNRQTEIVGVVDDVRYGTLHEPAQPSLYFPYRQAPFRRMTVVLKTSGEPASLVPLARRVVRDVDPNLPLSKVMTLSETVGRSMARERFATLLVTLFGAVALTLAAVGIYGVLSFTVAQRTRELGVRIALGANAPHVVSFVMRKMVLLIGVGVGLGVLGATAVTRGMSSQLFGVTAHDPVIFGLVAALIAGLGCLSSYLPARRATRISPLTALHSE